MRILNVDLMGCLHWHYHAKDAQLSLKFLRTLKEIIAQFRIDRTLLLLEGGSQYRLSLDPGYKSARRKRREEQSDKEKRDYRIFLAEADEFVKEIAPSFALTPLRVRGAEADDLAGYLCAHIDTSKHQVFNLSGDQDWYQMLRPNVVQGSYAEIKKAQADGWEIPKTIWLSRSGFEERYGIPVENWIWKKCLSGDTGDSVPGFPALGDGTALALLKEYGGIRELERNRETLHVPRMRAEAKAAVAENFPLVYENHRIMNLCFSPEEEIRIFGARGIAYLQGAIEGLEEKTTFTASPDLQELCFRRGWLEIDEGWAAPFFA